MIQEDNQSHDFFSFGRYIRQACEILVTKEFSGISQCGI